MSNRKPNQATRVQLYIERFGSITSLDAFKDLGITRLSARIWELRHDKGLMIKRTPEKAKNRFGENVTYYRYQIVGNKHETA